MATRRATRVWLLAVTLVLCAYAGISLSLGNSFALTTFGDVTQFVLLLGCFVSTLPNQVSNRGRASAFWTLMSVGFALWLVMQAQWTLYEVILHKDIPTFFWGDAFLYVHVVPMMLAFATQPHACDSRRVRVDMINASLLMLWSLYLYVFFIIAWQSVVPNAAAYNLNYNLVEAAANMVVIVMALICWLASTGAWNKLYAHWLGASVLFAVSSYIGDVAIDKNVYYSGSLYDLPLVASMLWFAAIGFAVAPSLAYDTSIADLRRGTSWVSRLTAIVVVAAPTLGVWRLLAGGVPLAVEHFRLTTTVIVTVLSVALIMFRRAVATDRRRERLPLRPAT
jgi:hypothetical protein